MGHAGLDGDFFRTDRKLLFAEQGITKVEQMLKSLNSNFFSEIYTYPLSYNKCEDKYVKSKSLRRFTKYYRIGS